MSISQNILCGEEREELMPAHISYWPKLAVLNPCLGLGGSNVFAGQLPGWR